MIITRPYKYLCTRTVLTLNHRQKSFNYISELTFSKSAFRTPHPKHSLGAFKSKPCFAIQQTVRYKTFSTFAVPFPEKTQFPNVALERRLLSPSPSLIGKRASLIAQSKSLRRSLLRLIEHEKFRKKKNPLCQDCRSLKIRDSFSWEKKQTNTKRHSNKSLQIEIRESMNIDYSTSKLHFVSS